MSEILTEKPYMASEIVSGETYIDDVVPELVERLQSTTLDDFEKQMVNPRLVRFTQDSIPQLRFVDLRSEDEGFAKKAVVLPLPFGNPYSPAMHIRAKAVQDLLPEDTRVLVFPNNTRKEANYSFEFLEQHDAVETLGHLILKTCARLKLEEIVVSGYSQGASVGASILRDAPNYDINVATAILGDPADVEQRTPKQLRKAFMGTSLSDLNGAINDSAIPALSEAQLSRGGFDSVRQLMRFAGVYFDSRIAENVALHESMTSDRFVPNIADAVSANKGTLDAKNLHVVRMGLSKIATAALDEQMSEDPALAGRLTVVEGYGHEGGDNVFDWAIRMRDAVKKSGFYDA
jgi:pimeloyl-ACP methyl ester carboxylesterase